MFVAAGIGFVIGFKNIWLFPHHLALYGGSAYLVVYLAFLLLLGLPLLMTQTMLGRLGKGATPVRTLGTLTRRVRAPKFWKWLGALSVLAGFLVWSYYNVVAGWVLAYAARGLGGTLNDITAEGAASVFTQLIRDPEKQLFWHSVFVMATLLALTPGLRHGLERVVRVTLPAVVVLYVLLVGYAAGSGSFLPALEYFLRIDFSQLGSDGVLVAMGDAFFSLGLGVGTFMMYGAYLAPDGPVLRPAFQIVLADLASGVLASCAVYPVLFAGGSLSAAGPGLVFQSLAVAFDSLPLGGVMRVLLFLLLMLLAWLSTIGLAEPVLAWLTERRGWTRTRAAAWTGFAVWILGVVQILSLHVWAFPFTFFGVSRTLGFFDLMIVLTSFFLLPLVGIGTALFAGWVLRPDMTRTALAIASPCIHDVWLWLNRLVIPLLLLLMLTGVHLFL